MRLFLAIATGILFITFYLLSPLNALETGLELAVYTRGGLKGFVHLGLEGPQSGYLAQRAGNRTTYTNGVYRIRITETAVGMRSVIRVQADAISGEPFNLNKVEFRVSVPRGAVDGVWYPSAE